MMFSSKFNFSNIKKITVQTLHDGFFKLVRLSYDSPRYQGGRSQVVGHEVLLRPEAVVVLGYDVHKDQVVLIEQLRSGLVACGAQAPWLTEVVAGLCEDNEPVHTTAVRELEEETGLSTEVLIPIASYWVSPGGTSEKVHAFCALVDSEQAGEYGGLANEGEDIKIKMVSRQDLLAGLYARELNNSATVLCAQWLALHFADIKKKIESKESVNEWIYIRRP